MMTAISNLDLQVLVIPVLLMPSMYYQTLANSSMIPTKLQWHLHIKHVDCKDKSVMFFKCKYDKLKHSQTSVTSVIKDENYFLLMAFQSVHVQC
jgi:hypothetical protein